MRRFLRDQVPRPSRELDFTKVRAFPTISLEIGCGVGRFPLQLAQRRPDQAVIAIEKTIERFTKFKNRIDRHAHLPNLFALHSEAVSVITHFVPPLSLDEIYILYPNPYPKLRQRNLRWANRAFMGFLLERLKVGGRLTLATNIEDYFEETLERMQHTWDQKLVEKRTLSSRDTPRTAFEKKYLERGQDCWNLIFEKP